MGRPRKPETDKAVKTSITIDRALLERAKEQCARTGDTLSGLIARALSARLSRNRLAEQTNQKAARAVAEMRKSLDELERALLN